LGYRAGTSEIRRMIIARELLSGTPFIGGLA